MDFLARREHSFFELKQKLLIKYPELDPIQVDLALNQLQTENLLSDERFAESYIRYRKRKCFGYLHIKANLESRRVHHLIIAKYLYIDDDDWEKIALELVTKKVRDQSQIQYGSKSYRKIMRFMKSRGFTINEIIKAIDQTMTIRNTSMK